MRALLFTLFLLPCTSAFASDPPDVAQPKSVTYHIAPGVSVTSFYEGADQATGGFDMPASALSVSTPLQNTYAAAPVVRLDDQHRFNMQQDGKAMKADDFDRWMKDKGVRVVKKDSIR